MNSTPSQSRPRPLSPHVGIYSWLITSTTSILHRLSGVLLAFGLLAIVCWLVILAYAPQSYNAFMAFFNAPFGLALLFGWTAAIYYHLANGIRHLLWDAGIGFELKTVNKTGPLVIIVAAALTLATWGYVWL